MSIVPRDYAQLELGLIASAARADRMRAVVDAVWNQLAATGISWVGFYLHEGGDELILHTCRNRPACSPIGLYGACGTVFKSGEPLVVRDVRDLGDHYVACDPRDQSEVVIPCFEHGKVWGVLDLDSFDVGAFDESDVAGLTALLKRAGLTEP